MRFGSFWYRFKLVDSDDDHDGMLAKRSHTARGLMMLAGQEGRSKWTGVTTEAAHATVAAGRPRRIGDWEDDAFADDFDV